MKNQGSKQNSFSWNIIIPNLLILWISAVTTVILLLSSNCSLCWFSSYNKTDSGWILFPSHVLQIKLSKSGLLHTEQILDEDMKSFCCCCCLFSWANFFQFVSWPPFPMLEIPVFDRFLLEIDYEWMVWGIIKVNSLHLYQILKNVNRNLKTILRI